MSTSLRWYLQRDGKAAGPYSLEDLKNQVRQGVLLGHDLVFLEGGEEWKRAFDWPQLAVEIFSEERTSFTRLFSLPRASSAADGDWIVLIRQEEDDGLRFKQEGPYTSEQVRGLLQEKKLKPSDHVWKRGFAKWVPVYVRDEFSASLWNVKSESVPLLEQVVEMPPTQGAKPGSKADLISLLPENSHVTETPAPSVILPVVKESAAKRVVPPVAAQASVPQKKGPRKSGWPAAFASILIIASGGIILQQQVLDGDLRGQVRGLLRGHFPWSLQQYSLPSQEQVIADEPIAVDNESELLAEETDESTAPLATLKSSVSEDKKSLIANTSPEKSVPPEKPFLWSLRLQKAAGEKVVVLINGASGKILGAPALSLKSTQSVPASGILDLEPKKMKLPEGRYSIQIQQNGKAFAKFDRSYIVDAARFERQLREHRKQIVFEQQKEKRSLLRALDQLEKFLKDNNSALTKPLSAKEKKHLTKALLAIERPETRVSKQDRHALIYANAWSGLALHLDDLKEALEAAGRRRPAGKQNLEVIRKKVVNLRTQVRRTTFWGGSI